MASVGYQEHLAYLIKQEMGARAERYGFVDAKEQSVPTPFGTDYEQQRYQQGFDDGKIMLAVEEAR